jgi:uncharacterized protein
MPNTRANLGFGIAVLALFLGLYGFLWLIKEKPPTMQNPIAYVEIPVTDLARARAFYTQVFGMTLGEPTRVDGYDMVFFPFAEGAPGVTAALVKGDVYVPSTSGPIVYFHTDAIEATLAKAVAAGGHILYPVKSVGEFGHVAEFKDTEGNRIALNQPL